MALRETPSPLYKAYRSEPSLTPVARPVDIFVRAYPDPNAGSELLQLADALKSIQPKLSAYFDTRREELTEEEIAKGIKAYEENRKSWSEYLKEHPEHAGFSPHFQKGYRSMWLREQARRLAQEKRDAYEKGVTVDLNGNQVDIREVENAQAFEDWSGKFNQEWIQANLKDVDSKEFAENFLPIINQHDSQLLQLHIARRAEAYREGYTNAFYNEIVEAVGEAVKAPDFDSPAGKASVIQRLGDLISVKTSEAMQDGLTAKEANDLAVTAVLDAAKSIGGHEGIDLLESLMKAKAGTGALGNIGKYKIAIQKAQEEIEEKYMGLEMKRWQFEKLKSDRVVNQVLQNYYAQMWTNPTKNWDKEIAEVSRMNWEAGEALRSHLSSIRASYELDSRGRPLKKGGGGGGGISEYLGLELLNLETLTENGAISPAEAEKQIQAIIASNRWGLKDQKSILSTLNSIRKGTKSTLNSVMSQIDPLLKRAYLGNDLFTDKTSPSSINRYREARAAVVSEMLRHIQNTGEQDPVNLELKADEVLKKVFKYFPTDTTQKSDVVGFRMPKPIVSGRTNIKQLTNPLALTINVDMNAGHFKSSKEFLQMVTEWSRNPFDPANPINIASKRLKMSPRIYILQQGQFYFDLNGQPLSERLKTEL